MRHAPVVTLASPGPVEEGASLELHCRASAYPSTVSWTWTINQRLVEGREGEVLRLEEVGAAMDGARVGCTVSNTVGSTEATVGLEVRHGPRLVEQPEDVTVRSGEMATFRCGAESNPPPRYESWKITLVYHVIRHLVSSKVASVRAIYWK